MVDVGISNNRVWYAVTRDCTEPSQNIWRENAELKKSNIRFHAVLGSGSFGIVYHISNVDTDEHYALKVIPCQSAPEWEPGEFDHFDKQERNGCIIFHSGLQFLAERMNDTHHGMSTNQLAKMGGKAKMGGDMGEQIATNEGNGRAFWDDEVRPYLQFIRSGHPNIAALEAFGVNYLPPFGGINAFYELCDAGDLSDLVTQFWFNKTIIPEAFIWKVYSELLSALSFLHRTGEDYADDNEVIDRFVITHNDVRTNNVFLKWPAPYHDGQWPDVKLGDFGKAVYFTPPPKRKQLLEIQDPLRDHVTAWWAGTLPESNGPENPEISDKMDVYAAGNLIHWMATRGLYPRTLDSGAEAQGEDLPPWDRQNDLPFHASYSTVIHPFPSQYSSEIRETVVANLVDAPAERPTAGTMLELVRDVMNKDDRPWPDAPNPPGWLIWQRPQDPVEYTMESEDELDSSDDDTSEEAPMVGAALADFITYVTPSPSKHTARGLAGGASRRSKPPKPIASPPLRSDIPFDGDSIADELDVSIKAKAEARSKNKAKVDMRLWRHEQKLRPKFWPLFATKEECRRVAKRENLERFRKGKDFDQWYADFHKQGFFLHYMAAPPEFLKPVMEQITYIGPKEKDRKLIEEKDSGKTKASRPDKLTSRHNRTAQKAPKVRPGSRRAKLKRSRL